MILYHALRQLFPNADFLNDIILRNDGEGDYIEAWNLPDPQPTPTELEAAWQAWLADEPNRQARLDRIRLAREGLGSSDFAALKAELVAASSVAQLKTVMAKMLRNQYRLSQALEFVDEDDIGQ